MPSKHWREYEKIVADLHKTFHGDVSVEHDVRIKGTSGIMRQLDVVIRHRSGLYDILIVVDCKDYNRPVNRTRMAGFVDLRDDVCANLGVVVAPKGFTNGARELAKQKGVQMFTSYSSDAETWSANLRLPVLLQTELLFCDFRNKFDAKNPELFRTTIQTEWDAGNLPFQGDRCLHWDLPCLEKEGGPIIAYERITLFEQKKRRVANLPLEFFGLRRDKTSEVATDKIGTPKIRLIDVLNWNEAIAGDDYSRHLRLWLRMVIPSEYENGHMRVLVPDWHISLTFRTLATPFIVSP